MEKLRRHMYKATATISKEIGLKPSRAGKRKLKLAETISASVDRRDDPHHALNTLCDIASHTAAVDDKIVLGCKYYSFAPTSASRTQLRRYSALVLYFAWCDKDVLLPVNFKMQKAVTPEMRSESPSLVLRTLATYEPEAGEFRKFGKHIQQWLTQYSLSWIYCTNWIKFSDIKNYEAAQLHVAISGHNVNMKGNPSSVERAIQIFGERGYIEHDSTEFDTTKKHGFLSNSNENLESEQLDAFIVPGRRSERSCFYLLPQLEVDGFALDPKVIQLWDKLFDDYIIHREQTGRSANESKRRSFHVLADYIAIVLPTFSMQAPDPIDMPVSPKKFTRYPFIDQTLRPRSFPTYLEYLKKRGLAASSRKSNLYVIEDFFKWIELNFATEEFSNMAGPGFRCPIHKRDFPFVPRPTGTTKVPFKKDVYPLVFLYLHEIERIGMYLETNPGVASELCDFSSQAGDHVINLRELNVEFTITYQDETFRIFEIPQILLVGVKKAFNGINLGALRLLTFILETGLRGQSSQWLDKDSWAKFLDDFSDEDPIKLIHINTDKTGVTKDIRVLSRVVEMLQRQQDHRKSKKIPEVILDYERRTASPFKPLVPLFAKEDGSEFTDGNYTIVWTNLLLSFQGCMEENGFDIKPVIRVKPPSKHDTGTIRADGSSICRLNWSAVHTPHAARASFVTNRNGSLEYVVLAELIGHADEIVTAYYDVPDFEDVLDVLEHQDRPPLDASSPTSELRSQLTLRNDNKEEVIRRFGISSLEELQESEGSDDNPKGLELLKSSQTSELVFRETHICPVGEMCPDDIILAAGAPMRCGTCKLACKSVDHLPAIEAKCRALTAGIQATSASLVREKAEGRERTRLTRLHGALSADSYQLVGWQDASVTLRRLLKDKQAEGIVAGSPEIIKRHLNRVVRQVGPAQFLVDRIIDAKMYPSMTDEVLQRHASRLARKLAISETEMFADENDEVMALYSVIKTRLKALGKTWDEAGALIEQDVGTLIAGTKSNVRLLNARA
ncbi:hypothetical protein [Sulfitobacter dubius]|nr:hypothetical protein [Sulfitobacter dubius]